MKYFLVVFTIGVLAFGDAFLSIDQKIIIIHGEDEPEGLTGTFY